ncbi:MAG: PIN domain-containing protein [Kiritimatiellae bacterium]|nr:PIN domain-containing protein [Kiritimatiellia bacterium]
MNLLLDTHILLWWLDDHPNLPNEAKQSIENPNHLIVVSVVTLWAIAIKASLGKIDVPTEFEAALDGEPFQQLAIKLYHAHAIRNLPAHHRDPFDRMLVVQTQQETLTLMTHDKQFSAYDLKLILV